MDGGTGNVGVRRVVADHGSQIAMIGRDEIGRITNSTTKFDWLKGIGIVKGNELSNNIGS